jgi:hypothetical protein
VKDTGYILSVSLSLSLSLQDETNYLVISIYKNKSASETERERENCFLCSDSVPVRFKRGGIRFDHPLQGCTDRRQIRYVCSMYTVYIEAGYALERTESPFYAFEGR